MWAPRARLPDTRRAASALLRAPLTGTKARRWVAWLPCISISHGLNRNLDPCPSAGPRPRGCDVVDTQVYSLCLLRNVCKALGDRWCWHLSPFVTVSMMPSKVQQTHPGPESCRGPGGALRGPWEGPWGARTRAERDPPFQGPRNQAVFSDSYTSPDVQGRCPHVAG